jgi:RND family efflux transporter MFP subunit
VTGLLLASCSAGNGEGGDATPAVSAGVGRAVVRDYRVTVSGLSTVMARPGGAAKVSAPGESVVTAIRVAAGDVVQAGAPLVELDQTVWREQARHAEAELATAEAARTRAESLVGRGILPAKDLQAAQAAEASARAAAADARRNLDRSVLRSPISGVVTAVNAAVSQPVAAADVLVEVIDLSELDAAVQLTPDAAGLVTAGDSVTLFSGIENPGEPVAAGVVRGVSSQVASPTGTVVVRVALDTPTRPVRVGLSLLARIVVARHEEAVVIPRDAIVPVTDGMEVYVVDDAGVAHATAVVLGASDPDSVEVTSGLSGDEQIVTEGAYGIVDGARVEATPAP